MNHTQCVFIILKYMWIVFTRRNNKQQPSSLAALDYSVNYWSRVIFKNIRTHKHHYDSREFAIVQFVQYTEEGKEAVSHLVHLIACNLWVASPFFWWTALGVRNKCSCSCTNKNNIAAFVFHVLHICIVLHTAKWVCMCVSHGLSVEHGGDRL